MVEESIICAPMDREHLGFAYTIYLVTLESSYNVSIWEVGLTLAKVILEHITKK